MSELNEKLLATFRVRKSGNLPYRDRDMSSEEIIARRAYLRKTLIDSERSNLSNDVLDNIRLVDLGNNNLVFEDERGYEFNLRGKSAILSREESEFRKCRSMIPFEFKGLDGNAFDWSVYNENVEKSKGYVNNFILKFEHFSNKGMGLYIYSATKGSGKTMLSCCILNELTKRYSVSVKFINSLDLLELTKQSYRGYEPEELNALYTAKVLVVDDIGVQMSKEWIDTVFYRLINVRYNNKLVTIYTSNIASDKLKIDDRIVDRIESTSYLVHLPEKAVRSEKKAQEKENILREIENAPFDTANIKQGIA